MSNTYKHKKCTTDSLLYVVTVISNPAQYEKRYQLFTEFCDRMLQNSQVYLYTVELQQRARPFMTNANLKLRTKDELWHKENLINIAVQNLPDTWEYVCWVDADLHFQNDNWVQETIDALQTYEIVQPWCHCIDMGPKFETLQVHTGFFYQYCNGEQWKPSGYGKYWHPGYAMAYKKSAFNSIGGLIDFAILGSADFHMAMSLIGDVDKSLNHALHPNYKKLCKIWEERCEKHINRNVGYVHGTIMHYWHADKKNRRYIDRWKILVNNNYDPLRDIKRDHNGVFQLETLKYKLRDDIRRYFRQRNEDSNDRNQDYPHTKIHWI